MPIKDIKDKIMEDAIHEKENILNKTEKEINELQDVFQKEIDSLKVEILERYNQEAELKEKKIITEAKLEANKEILTEKQKLISEIFEEAENRIKNLDDRSYKKLMERLIIENTEQGDENIFIGIDERETINDNFIEEINKKLKSRGEKGELKLSNKRLQIKGGIIIGTEEIRKNASIEILLAKIKEDLEAELNNFLFQKKEE